MEFMWHIMRKEGPKNQAPTGHDESKRNKEGKVSNMLSEFVWIDRLTRSKKDGKMSEVT